MSTARTAYDATDRLTRLLQDADLSSCFGGRTVILPTRLVQHTGWQLTTTALLGSGLSFVSVPVGSIDADRAHALVRAAVAERLTALEKLTAAAVAWLSDRSFGGQSIGRMQLVEGTVADLIGVVAMSRQVLATDPTNVAALRDLTRRLPADERRAIALFGASGYERGHLSEQLIRLRLVTETWMPDADHAKVTKDAA